MKKYLLSILTAAMCWLGQPVFSQGTQEAASDSTTLLGLPGDGLDLYAALDLFQKSKTIEDFEKSLNDQKTGINNLDLDLDKKVDFIKVVTKQKDDSFSFILQDHVSEKETQDVAVILVDKDKKGKVTIQIVGDKELYGKDYIVEPKPSSPAVTANPGYTGADPVKSAPATTGVVVETVPIVQYVYSPVYVPYVPPYYYGFYPPYFAAFTVMAIGIYHSNHYYHHHGGYHNTVVIHNHNNYNNYNGNRNTSDRVSHNNANGRYNNGNGPNQRPSNGNSASQRPSNSNRPSTTPSNRRSDGSSAGTSDMSRGGNRGGDNNRAGNNMSGGSNNRQSPSNNMSRGGGGGRSMGGGGFGGGGGSRGGGGGGGRRR